MNHDNDDTPTSAETLARLELVMAEHLVPQAADAGATAALEQIVAAEATGRPVWTFTDDERPAAELLEVRAAALAFPPQRWWRPPHPESLG
jgi:hypothetical protein